MGDKEDCGMSRHAVQVRITTVALSELLGLSDGHRVTAVLPQDAADMLHDTVNFIIEGEGLPLIPEGAAPPTVGLEYLKMLAVDAPPDVTDCD